MKPDSFTSCTGVDAILLNNLSNLRYFTNFTGSSGFAVISKKQSYFLTDNRYRCQAKKEIDPAFKIIIYDQKSLQPVLTILKKVKPGTLGIEAESLPFSIVKKIKSQMKGLKLGDVSEKVLMLRSVKTNEELKKIKKALHIAEQSFKKIQGIIKPGLSEKDIALELDYEMRKNGCEKIAFSTIVASGVNSALPHAHATNQKIKNNSILLLDFGCTIDGYSSDITRVIFIGKSKPVFKKMFYTVKEAYHQSINFLSSNREASILTHQVDRFIRKSGFKDGLIHSLGHGVGLDIHELPVLSKFKKSTLRSGHVFTIEPGIYIPHLGGIRLENMIHLTEKGPEVLNKLPMEFSI
ncbi:MAG: aminopeptidase P family protein [Spirochaetes bacterium]|nr:aminopeptidase P family protein [Spirochaetota bacterium]